MTHLHAVTEVVHVYGPKTWDVYIGGAMPHYTPQQGAPDWLWEGSSYASEPWRLAQIHRGHALANPFRAGKHGTVYQLRRHEPDMGISIKPQGEILLMEPEEAVMLYRAWLRQNPQIWREIEPLRGKVLACWCKAAPPFSRNQQDAPCHGDVLAHLLNGGQAAQNEIWRT